MLRYLIIEDEKEVASYLKEVVETLRGKPYVAYTGEEALSIAESYIIDIALVDLMLPDIDGIKLIGQLKTVSPETIFIVITSVYETQSIVSAIKEGASEYITKPFELTYLQKVLKTYQELINLRRKTYSRSSEEISPLERIIGGSPQIENIKKMIREIAPYDSTVLITGPTGVGKGLIAEVIHTLSQRNEGPFVVLDCTVVPEGLMESELFGHTKGAFTGAHQDRAGLIERADGGTLFIDEIGELNLQLQAKLLRVIDTGEFRRVGATKTRKADVRIITATNKNLEEMVKAGKFREDLYYRLNVIQLRVPPLSERGEDAWLLANHFLCLYTKNTGKRIRGFSKEAERFIKTYNWPGNIRELKNLIERAVVMSEGPWIALGDFAAPVGRIQREEFVLPKEVVPLREMERRYIEYVLKLTGNNKSQAAALLGITRKTLREKLKNTG
jgi:DNA-binding NtrC family response regulator